MGEEPALEAASDQTDAARTGAAGSDVGGFAFAPGWDRQDRWLRFVDPVLERAYREAMTVPARRRFRTASVIACLVIATMPIQIVPLFGAVAPISIDAALASAAVRTGIEEGALASLCASTIEIGEPLSVIQADELSRIPFLCDQGFVFLVIVTLTSERNATGLLFLVSRVGSNVDLEFVSLMALVGNHISHIIDKIRLFEETRRLSITDALTGLYNTRYFYKTLDIEIARTNRYGTPFSLVLFDIDNFKILNDNYGHQAGDGVLQELAQILKSISRETDTSVRYGGEEFIIVLPNTPEEETIFLANRIRKAVQEHNFIVSATEKVNITLSGGIASYPKDAGDAKSLLNAADTALYAAKAAGKNVVICCEGDNQ